MNEKLTIISNGQKGESFTLEGDKIAIGRVSSNEIILKDSSISREHCIIEKKENNFYISDLHSLNGTFVNGAKAENTKLNHGDKINIGDFALRFQTKEFVEPSDEVLLDKTEFRLPKTSVRIRFDEVFGEMARDLTAILRISNKINTLRDTQELQSELLRQIFEVIPAENGAILLVDDENEFVEMVGLNKDEQEDSTFVSQTIVSQVLDKQEVILVTDLASDEDIKKSESLVISKVSTLLCVPIILFEQTLGVIYLSGTHSNFDDSHLRFLSAISGIAAIAIENARNFAFLEDENKRLRGETFEQNMLGKSEPMQKVFSVIKKVAPADSNVLINGESGTGKELAAKSLHLNSKRKDKPFIAINCAALTENLLESELFGHKKGAFTGATATKKGKIEMANGGTLFLDEIGDLPPQTQVKLLRVLQEKKFERLGGTETIKVNVRLITATNKNLEEEIANGNFREDLFYRLNVFTIFLPPLRQRKSDILLLAEHFVEKYEIEHNKRVRRISTPAIDMLTSYHYPGNVRELENAIERAVLVCDSNVIHGHHLPPTLQTAEVSGTITDMSLASAVEAFERDMIIDALKSTRGNVAKASKLLNSTERIIGYKIKKYEIIPRRFR